jgi:phage terminase large subunit-like protein
MITEELEKVDVIRERTGVDYEQAVEALRSVDGDVLEAIIKLEKEEKQKYTKEEFQVRGQQVLSRVKDLIRKGNVTRVKVKKDDKVLVDIPVTAGVVGTVIAPYLTVLAGIAALASKCTIEVERLNRLADRVENDIDNSDEF